MTQPTDPPRPTIAIAAHLYNAELWPELAALIRQAPASSAVYVTLPQSSLAAATVLADFPRATIRQVPNLGRDVAPFVSLLPELMAFDIVCKVHAKRYAAWRIEALRGVLGGSRLVEHIVAAFANTPDLMLAGSGALFVDGCKYMYGSGNRLRAYQSELPASFGFFAGTMFWTRPSLFADFVEAFPFRYFIPHSDLDGQLEHMIERMFGLRAATLGGLVGLTSIVNGVPDIEFVAATAPTAARFGQLVGKQLPERYEAYPADWYVQQQLLVEAPAGPFDRPE